MTPMASIPSEPGRMNTKRPEEVTYRGVNLPIACAKGDLPLVAMLIAEGSEQGLDMLEADKVRSPSMIALKGMLSWLCLLVGLQYFYCHMSFLALELSNMASMLLWNQR